MGVELLVGTAIAGGIVSLVSNVFKGSAQRAEAREEAERGQEMLDYEKEATALKWEKAQQQAEQQATELEEQAAHLEERAEEAKALGFDRVAVGHEQLFAGQEQAEAQYGEMLRGAAEAESSLAARAGTTGLRNTGSLQRVQEYRAEIHRESLERARGQIDVQREIGTQQLGLQKESILNTYDDALWRSEQTFEKAQQIREDYGPDSLNEQLYENTMTGLESQYNFLSEDIESNKDTFLTIAGDIFTGLPGALQTGHGIYTGLKGTGWFDTKPKRQPYYMTRGQVPDTW
jgi:hypothetical protein